MSVHPHYSIKAFSVPKLLVSLTNSTRHDYLRLQGTTNPQPQVILRTNCSDTINVTSHLIIKGN